MPTDKATMPTGKTTTEPAKIPVWARVLVYAAAIAIGFLAVRIIQSVQEDRAVWCHVYGEAYDRNELTVRDRYEFSLRCEADDA